MQVINASTIGNLISAHIEGDENKFLAYANFIADAYKEAWEAAVAERDNKECQKKEFI